MSTRCGLKVMMRSVITRPTPNCPELKWVCCHVRDDAENARGVHGGGVTLRFLAVTTECISE